MGKDSKKNSLTFCSECEENYVKIFDVNFKDLKKSVVLDLNTVPFTPSNPFIKYSLGHFCRHKTDK